MFKKKEQKTWRRWGSKPCNNPGENVLDGGKSKSKRLEAEVSHIPQGAAKKTHTPTEHQLGGRIAVTEGGAGSHPSCECRSLSPPGGHSGSSRKKKADCIERQAETGEGISCWGVCKNWSVGVQKSSERVVRAERVREARDQT